MSSENNVSNIGNDILNEKTLKNTENKPNLEKSTHALNCPEHIIFVVDTCIEEGTSKFKTIDGMEHTTLSFVQKVLSTYISNKHMINPKHKFGLIAFGETPVWIEKLTGHAEMLKKFEELKEAECPKQCNLTPIFDMIRNVISPAPTEPATLADYIVRIIFIYGRSNCIPELLDGNEAFVELSKNALFFFDIFYIHENPSDDNKCEGIYEILCNLDENGWNYICEVSKNSTKCFNYFSQLLAHPLQRPAQKDANYSLEDLAEPVYGIKFESCR